MSKSGKVSQSLAMIFGFILLGGLGYLIWIVSARLLLFLERADASVSAAVVGAMATVLVGVGGVLYTQAQTKRREIEEAHRARKVEIYKELLDMVARIMAEGNPNVSLKPPSQQELVNFMVGFKTNLLLWASPKVINAQLHFQKVSSSGGNVLKAVDSLYKAIREDIGLNNSGLSNHQLVPIQKHTFSASSARPCKWKQS